MKYNLQKKKNWTPIPFPSSLSSSSSVALAHVAVCFDILLQQSARASPDWFFMPTKQQLILAWVQRDSSSDRHWL